MLRAENPMNRSTPESSHNVREGQMSPTPKQGQLTTPSVGPGWADLCDLVMTSGSTVRQWTFTFFHRLTGFQGF